MMLNRDRGARSTERSSRRCDTHIPPWHQRSRPTLTSLPALGAIRKLNRGIAQTTRESVSNLAVAHKVGAPESLFHMKHEVLNRHPDPVSHETWGTSPLRDRPTAIVWRVSMSGTLGALEVDQAGAIRVIDFPIRWPQVRNVT